MTTGDSARSRVAASPGRGSAGMEYPRRFGERYVLLKELGKGGMGQVFMAVTGGQAVERVCALKVIRRLSGGRAPDELARRFLDEAKVVTKLSHENLVYVFDFGLLREVPEPVTDLDGADGPASAAYLGMEYLRGKTLTELWNRCALKQVGIPIAIALHVVSEVAAGLAYAHGLPGVTLVHRDVSPSNVMLTYTGGVKLIDFGLAKWSQKTTQTMSGVNWGKINYMSPEQHLGRAIDHRSDIYSLGVILWELLAGRQLFPTEEARRATLELPPPSRFNPAISPELDALVLRALAGEASARIDSAAALAQALPAHLPPGSAAGAHGKLGLARFMSELFAADAEQEQAEEERLLSRASGGELGPATGSARAPADSDDPLLGATLAGRYYVRRKIGEGSMGAVYEGHHTGIGKRVAIKIPHHSERRKERLLARFRLEANAASQIGHPNIADVTDCGTTPSGDFFFVMEYVDGTDLGKVLRRSGPLALERVLLVAIQVCRALEAAHKAGIIHRDLKPSNVMLVRDREDNELVKVLDFGVAKFLRQDPDPAGELTQADAAVGTPRYMAPEQIEAGRAIDFRVDIYATGSLLYAMLTGGRVPFEADSVHALWRRKLGEDPDPIGKYRSDLPASLEALVMRCLARDPEARPSSMEELRRGLLACLEEIRKAGSSVLAMRLPSSTSLVEGETVTTGLRRGPLLAAGAALVTAALGVGLLATRERTAPPAVVVSAPGGPAGPAAPAPEPASPAAATAPLATHQAAPPARDDPREEPPAPASDATSTAPSAPGHARPGAPAAPAVVDETAYRALLDQGEDAYRREQLVQATVFARKALAARPTVEAYLLLGKALLHRDDRAGATAAYEAALRLQPGNPSALRGLQQARARPRPDED